MTTNSHIHPSQSYQTHNCYIQLHTHNRYGDATEGFYKSAITPARLEKPDATARAWLPNVYEGGKHTRPGGTSQELLEFLNEHDEPSQWRVQVSVCVYMFI